jgi:hypothetical protein
LWIDARGLSGGACAWNAYLVFLDQDNFFRGPDNAKRHILGRYNAGAAHWQQWLEKMRDLSRKAQ